MRANTGNAVTDIETPIKSANTTNGTSAEEKGGYSHKANPLPRRKGTMMLACDVATEACVRSRSRSVFSSTPTRNMYKMTPTLAMTDRYGATWFGSR